MGVKLGVLEEASVSFEAGAEQPRFLNNIATYILEELARSDQVSGLYTFGSSIG